MRRTAHAHAGVSWKCQNVSWSHHSDVDDAADADDDDQLSVSPGIDVAERVLSNFTGLMHSLHSWYDT